MVTRRGDAWRRDGRSGHSSEQLRVGFFHPGEVATLRSGSQPRSRISARSAQPNLSRTCDTRGSASACTHVGTSHECSTMTSLGSSWPIASS